MRVQADPRTAGRLLAVVILLLVTANLLGQISTYYLGHGRVFGFVRLFALDEEANIPTWYSSMTLFVCAMLLGVIAAALRNRNDRGWRHWAGLAFIFAYLSADEAASIHELSIAPLHDLLGIGGFLRWAWVIPGALFVAVVGIVYLKFILALPPATRRLFVIAAALFVGGALGIEMIGGAWFDRYGNENMGYALIWTTEETLEMAGVAVFIYALLRHIGDQLGSIELSFEAIECGPGVTAADADPRVTAADPVPGAGVG